MSKILRIISEDTLNQLIREILRQQLKNPEFNPSKMIRILTHEVGFTSKEMYKYMKNISEDVIKSNI
jgi:hypothetical protein